MNWWWGECPYSTKTREVFGNPSPPPSRFPWTLEISQYLPRFGGARIQCSPLHITQILKWQPIDCGQEEPKSWTTDYKFLSFQICSDSQAQKAVDCRRTFYCCLLSLRSLLCYSLVWSQVYWCNWFNPETVFPRINRSGAVWHSRSWNGVMRWVVHPLDPGNWVEKIAQMQTREQWPAGGHLIKLWPLWWEGSRGP